jgi:hypothetical protein
MSTIDLSSHGLDGSTFKTKLLQAIQAAPLPIVSLNLKQNKLDLECLEFLLQQQALIPTLKELNLSNNFSEKNSDAICEKILIHATFTQTSFEQLEKLDLGFNCISKTGAHYLVQALAGTKMFPALKGLYLRYNSIGMEGAAAVAQMLMSCQLTLLDLTGNNITDAGCAYICQAAMMSPTLKTLGLWGPNNITDASCDVLCTLISVNQNLEVLDLTSNLLTQPSLEKLYNTMEKSNTGLTDLRIIGNCIKDRYIVTKFNELNNKRTQAKEYLSSQYKSLPLPTQQTTIKAQVPAKPDTQLQQQTRAAPREVSRSSIEQEWSALNAAKMAFEEEKAQFQALVAQKEMEWGNLKTKIEQHVQQIAQQMQAQGKLNSQVKINIVLKQ